MRLPLDSREAIEAARAGYDALTDEQKALVTGLDALKAAESKYQELKAAADKEAAAEVDSLIGAIGDDIIPRQQRIYRNCQSGVRRAVRRAEGSGNRTLQP